MNPTIKLVSRLAAIFALAIGASVTSVAARADVPSVLWNVVVRVLTPQNADEKTTDKADESQFEESPIVKAPEQEDGK